jgi:cytochrome c oxidase cbb3-type subunit 1
MWMEGTKSFIESVELMAPYWLWRAIGGSLMWLSHILFAYNFYVMVKSKEKIGIPLSPAEILVAKEELESKL